MIFGCGNPACPGCIICEQEAKNAALNAYANGVKNFVPSSSSIFIQDTVLREMDALERFDPLRINRRDFPNNDPFIDPFKPF